MRGRVSDREWRGMCESERETSIRLALFLKKPIRNRVSKTQFPGGTHKSVISTWMDTSHKN